ncbi:DNA-binding protein [Pseudoalteromonas sp. HM-SA03]|uniref:helix-turn-helix transcriptional regulator n=1 Tax=Pseudoalteromonas sp. HM-SA03 TaxID=2029678 RepID=UPI000BAE3E39|nr:helix-turn-helix domain-containing protein [Pseudoalteromonas sp. HM-SA03]PAY03174.1 DNA-binding protein [Pseudoalteromonas sp. HM-SA03]
MKKLFYRIDEIADLLYVSKQTLYNQINSNKKNGSKFSIPPYIKLHGRLLFPIDEFDHWLQAQPRS